MLLVLLFSVVFILALFTAKENKTKGFLAVLLALLYFPIGVIMALSKKYR